MAGLALGSVLTFFANTDSKKCRTDPDAGDVTTSNNCEMIFLAVAMQFDAPFPLTPALSPGERENHLAAQLKVSVY